VDFGDLRDLDDRAGVSLLDRPVFGAVHVERLMDANP